MTARCFVAGDPVAHSRSPLIHGNWIARLGLDAVYGKEPCPVEALPGLMARVRSGEFRGGNLTVPLKEAALPLVDRLTEEAAAMGAVNTVFMQGRELWGDNTDVRGYFAALDEAAPGWDDAPVNVLMLGAGGAGRAIAAGLKRRRLARLVIANRSSERAAALVGSLADPRIVQGLWPPDAQAVGEARLVINTTSLGMAGKGSLALPWPRDASGLIASDIVYVPLETPFLAEARAAGAQVVDGLGMLLHQAALAFSRWFGVVPPVTPELRALIVADLERTR